MPKYDNEIVIVLSYVNIINFEILKTRNKYFQGNFIYIHPSKFNFSSVRPFNLHIHGSLKMLTASLTIMTRREKCDKCDKRLRKAYRDARLKKCISIFYF